MEVRQSHIEWLIILPYNHIIADLFGIDDLQNSYWIVWDGIYGMQIIFNFWSTLATGTPVVDFW